MNHEGTRRKGLSRGGEERFAEYGIITLIMVKYAIIR